MSNFKKMRQLLRRKRQLTQWLVGLHIVYYPHYCSDPVEWISKIRNWERVTNWGYVRVGEVLRKNGFSREHYKKILSTILRLDLKQPFSGKRITTK